ESLEFRVRRLARRRGFACTGQPEGHPALCAGLCHCCTPGERTIGRKRARWIATAAPPRSAAPDRRPLLARLSRRVVSRQRLPRLAYSTRKHLRPKPDYPGRLGVPREA